jgi:hypothetical protein
VSWAWLAPLFLGALGAGVCAKLARAVQRETARVKLARVEITEIRPRLRRNPASPAQGPYSSLP